MSGRWGERRAHFSGHVLTERRWDMGVRRSARARVVARWFGVDVPRAHYSHRGRDVPKLETRAGEVVLITGASGAGKSTLLRALRERAERWVDLNRVRLSDRAAIDVMVDALGGGSDELSIVAGLDALSRVGLGEVWTYLRKPRELSEGQRWRLRLAVALARATRNRIPGKFTVLACDEFGAVLDRVTAIVVARALRRAVSSCADVCAVVATGHEDLRAALAADVDVRCDFGEFEVTARDQSAACTCGVPNDR